MKWKAILQRVSETTRRAARAAASLCVRAAKQASLFGRATWRSRLRRRLQRPLLVSARVVLLAALLAGFVVIGVRTSVKRVPVTNVAVKQVNWGSSSGVTRRDYTPGFHWGPPGFTSWHLLDARTHFLRFGMKSEGNELPELELLTPDDLQVRLSVTVPYRIVPGRAHAVVADGLKSGYRQSAKTIVEKVLLQEFASLTSDEWADTTRRNSVCDTALAAVNGALDRVHLEAEAVLVTAAFFPMPYEGKLMEQKLASQRIETDATLARRDERKHAALVEARSITRAEELAAGWDYTIEEERLRLEQEAIDVERAADLFAAERERTAENAYQKAVAEGQLAIDRAEALREELTNQALQTEGGRVLLAREAARNLRFKSVTLDANNPDVPSVIDLDALVALLLGE